jgi:hypothetical protein
MLRRIMLAAAILSIAVTLPAVAQQAATEAVVAAPGTAVVIDTGRIANDFIQYIVGFFATTIGIVLTGYIGRLMQKAGIETTDARKAQLQALIVNGLNAGAAAAKEKLPGAGMIEIKNDAAAFAVRYAQDHGKDVIKALGLDPYSKAAIETIQARIETALVDPAAPTAPEITPPEGKPPVAAVVTAAPKTS